MRVHRLLVAGAVALVASLPVSVAAAASSDTSARVSVGSPRSPSSQNKQNEPGLALARTTRDCRGPASCASHVGSIGTLPKYLENGLVSHGDAELVLGPKRGADGKFSWAAGSRLYYSNIATNFGSTRDEQAFKGTGAFAMSRIDNVMAAAAGDSNAWMDPVIVSRQSSATFSDTEQLLADNAASSPFFGNMYVCNVSFRSIDIADGAPSGIGHLTRSCWAGRTTGLV